MLQQMNTSNLEEPTAEEIANHERADRQYHALQRLHLEVHPEWDDMVFTGWCGKQSLEDLLDMKTHVDYMSCYIQYAIDLKMAKKEG